MSRRRRREVRKKFYERCKPDAHAPTTETTSVATRRELTIRELQERLKRLEDRIADATLEIEAFREEARSEFASTRDLLERKLEEVQQTSDDCWPPRPDNRPKQIARTTTS